MKMLRDIEPADFIDVRISGEGERFNQCYDLLKATFSANELSERHVFLSDFALRLTNQQHSVIAPFCMIARFGINAVDHRETIISLICGCYLVIDPIQRLSIGFIEYLATHPLSRYTSGYGTAMLHAFEAQMRQIASQLDHRLLFMVGEASPDIVLFKSRRGYRWPVGSCYMQPPISFDCETGEPRSAPVPFLLMIKNEDGLAQNFIPVDVLTQAVRAIYAERYGLRPIQGITQGSITTRQKATDMIDVLLQQFIGSIAHYGNNIPLVVPDPVEFAKDRQQR